MNIPDNLDNPVVDTLVASATGAAVLKMRSMFTRFKKEKAAMAEMVEQHKTCSKVTKERLDSVDDRLEKLEALTTRMDERTLIMLNILERRGDVH